MMNLATSLRRFYCGKFWKSAVAPGNLDEGQGNIASLLRHPSEEHDEKSLMAGSGHLSSNSPMARERSHMACYSRVATLRMEFHSCAWEMSMKE